MRDKSFEATRSRRAFIARVRHELRVPLNLVIGGGEMPAGATEAAEYVRSLLPPPLSGPVKTEWLYIPSAQLGGDLFGYHWLDAHHFALYLLDVSGQGVGAAQLAVAVMNFLRSQSFPATDFRNPSDVVSALNEIFPMQDHNGMFFTIWYGVYHRRQRRMVYTSGGHPPAVLLTEATAQTVKTVPLRTRGMMIGATTDATYTNDACDVRPGDQLYLFSDGAYEITRPDGTMLTLDEFIEHLTLPSQSGGSDVERILRHVQELHGSEGLDDDFSLVKATFD